jgi:hypothetical protein
VADPKRLVLLKAICAHLEATVRRSRGYNFDLDGRVFRGRTVFGDDEPLPAVSILDSPQPDRETTPDKAAGSVQVEDYPLLVQGWAPEDRTNPTDPAHLLLADVKKALAMLMDPRAPATHRMPVPGAPGGLMIASRISGGVVRPPDAVSCRAYFFLPYTVTFKESLADPFKLD